MNRWNERNDDTVWRVKLESWTDDEMTTKEEIFFTDATLEELGKYLDDLAPVRVDIWLDLK